MLWKNFIVFSSGNAGRLDLYQFSSLIIYQMNKITLVFRKEFKNTNKSIYKMFIPLKFG